MNADNVYGGSDVTRQLQLIKLEMDKDEAERQQALQGGMKFAKSALDTWSGEQSIKTKELLAQKDAGGLIHEINPEYTDKKFLKRFFTPAKDRVRKIATQGSEDLVQKSTEEVLPDAAKAGAEEVGKSFGQKAGDFVGENLGKITGGLGVAAGLYGLSQMDWKKKGNDLGKIGALGSTGLGIASLLGVPGLGVPATILGSLGLFDKK